MESSILQKECNGIENQLSRINAPGLIIFRESLPLHIQQMYVEDRRDQGENFVADDNGDCADVRASVDSGIFSRSFDNSEGNL